MGYSKHNSCITSGSSRSNSFFFSFFSSGNETLNYLLDTVLLDYTINTIYLILLTSFFALLFGVFPAWVVSNNSFKGRSFFDVVLYLPLAIPSYIMGYTYIEILSFTGPIQTFVRYNTPLLSDFFNQDYLQVGSIGNYSWFSTLSLYLHSI